jgi:hypothetical protein
MKQDEYRKHLQDHIISLNNSRFGNRQQQHIAIGIKILAKGTFPSFRFEICCSFTFRKWKFKEN